MPFKTQYGAHYHMTEGCHGATIPCDTAGLKPCLDCCGESGNASNPTWVIGANSCVGHGNVHNFSASDFNNDECPQNTEFVITEIIDGKAHIPGISNPLPMEDFYVSATDSEIPFGVSVMPEALREPEGNHIVNATPNMSITADDLVEFYEGECVSPQYGYAY